MLQFPYSTTLEPLTCSISHLSRSKNSQHLLIRKDSEAADVDARISASHEERATLFWLREYEWIIVPLRSITTDVVDLRLTSPPQSESQKTSNTYGSANSSDSKFESIVSLSQCKASASQHSLFRRSRKSTASTSYKLPYCTSTRSKETYIAAPRPLRNNACLSALSSAL